MAVNAQNIRHVETINDLWYSYKDSIDKPFYDDSKITWDKVELPHSWNTVDILDDEDGYDRGDGWYKKTLVIPEVYENQQVFLLFEAANQVTSLYINGKPMDIHVNGATIWKTINLKEQYGGHRGAVKRFLLTVENDKGITVDFKAIQGQTSLGGIKLRKVN